MIKRIKLQNIDATLSYAFMAIIFIIILILFAENFIYSENFSFLSLREIDDVAFQASLRKIHLLMEDKAWGELFVLNDYAYGWIYWFFISSITYPFYLLQTHFQIDWPLIAMPRQMSLLFGVMSLMVLKKILEHMNIEKIYIMATLLIFVLFPTFGYFSMRFGTVNPILFFSILSFYYAQKNFNQKNIMFSVIALAIAGSIKLTGLFIAPFLALKLLREMFTKGVIVSLKKVIFPALIFITLLVLFTNPALLMAPFNQQYFNDYINNLQHFIAVTKLSADSMTPQERFYSGVIGSKIQAFVYILLLIGLFRYFLYSDFKKRKFLLDVSGTVFIVSIYLILNVNSGLKIGYYFASVSFLLLFGLLGFVNYSKTAIAELVSKVVFIAIIICMISDVYFRTLRLSNNEYNWSHFYYAVKQLKFQDKKQIMEEINQNLINKIMPNNTYHYFIDHTIPSPINTLNSPKSTLSYAWSNLSYSKRYYDRQVDFLILDKNAIGYMEQSLFDKQAEQADDKTKQNYLEDRESRLQLKQTGKFGADSYLVFYESSDILIYKNILTK